MSLFFEKLGDFCHDLLYRDKKMFKYYSDRNISASTIRKYKLGAFPKDLRLLTQSFSWDELIQNKIIWNASESPFKNGNFGEIYYPVVIPIKDFKNKTVAIGCRTLLKDDRRKELGIPKYKNSEYTKTLYLYGLDKAINAIREKDKVFVVEGYFDVISCHQAGIYNVVATCGTLFSRKQLVILARYTNNICLLFDNDEPGHVSSKIIMKKMSNITDIKLTQKFTPEGFKDIDDYLKEGGKLTFFKEKGVQTN